MTTSIIDLSGCFVRKSNTQTRSFKP